jgi:hypothetical protein
MDSQSAITQVLTSFAAAMHTWEHSCLAYLHRTAKKIQLDQSDIDEERRQKDLLQAVFKKYCVKWQEPVRGLTYGDPPDYHPDYFDILEIKVRGNKATAKIHQPALGRQRPSMGGGIIPMNTGEKYFVYHLSLTEDGWRLEDRRESHWEDGTVIKEGL